jgi:hypothetical protein
MVQRLYLDALIDTQDVNDLYRPASNDPTAFKRIACYRDCMRESLGAV